MKNEGLRVQNFFDKPEQYPVDDDLYEHEDMIDYGRERRFKPRLPQNGRCPQIKIGTDMMANDKSKKGFFK